MSIVNCYTYIMNDAVTIMKSILMTSRCNTSDSMLPSHKHCILLQLRAMMEVSRQDKIAVAEVIHRHSE